MYFFVLGLWGLINISTENLGPGIFVLITFHIVTDTVWILLDPHLHVHRNASKWLHHLVILILTVWLFVYPPWSLLISYASVIELSAFFVFVMKSFMLSAPVCRIFKELNIVAWGIFRWAIPLYGALYWTRWWELSVHGLGSVSMLLLGTASLVWLHLQWTLKIHRNHWEVKRISDAFVP